MKIDISQLEFVDQTLRNILVWIEKETGLEFTITSLYRIGDTGVHGQLPVRGCDLRMRDARAGREIEKMINQTWYYDPTRPEKTCCLLHGDGSNMHLHVQVHPNTIKQ